MDAADEAADPLERLAIVELRRAAAAPRIDGDPEIGEAQRLERRDHGNLALGELVREGVLFVDLRIAPASGPVELRDERRPIVEPHLVDAVLVAVERQQPAVGGEAGGGDGVQHDIRGEPRVGVGVHG